VRGSSDRLSLALLIFLAATALPSTCRAQDGSFLDRPVRAWEHDLSDTNAAIRKSAAFALGRIGGPALTAAPEIAKCLADPDAGVRAAAAEALGDIVLALHGGGISIWEAAGPALGKTLANDKDPRVRAAAAYALGACGERAASLAPALRTALHDPDARVRRNAARATGRLGEQAGDAVDDLCKLLKDSDALVRRDAVIALGSVGLPAARSAVRPLLALASAEKDGVVKRAALDKLVGLVGPTDRPAAGELFPILEQDDPDAARSAAFVLANMGGSAAARAVPMLQQTLHGDDDRLQALAAAALGSTRSEAAPAVIDLAKAMTESRSALVRRNAALALGQIGPAARDALPLLIKALAPSELREVRMFAAEAIMRIGNPANNSAVPALLRIVESDPDPEVRNHCAWCVAQRADHESNGISKVFAKILGETTPETLPLRYEAAWQLAARLRNRAPDRTVDVLFDLYRDRRLIGYSGSAVRVSGSGGESESGRAEVTAMRPAGALHIQIQAARALGWLGSKANRPDIVAELRKALKEDDPELRQAATEALKQIER
jgi:HEAT repeat protein